MKLHINKLHNALQRVKYASKYGIWYFEQFLDLKQEELSALQYSDQFPRLQDACGVEDDEEHDLISFVRGSRPDIVERMNDCTNIHEAYWDPICLERMLKRPPLGKIALQDEKSSQLIADHVKPVAEDI